MNAFDKAQGVVYGLCDGSIEWTMRIPADKERDPDIVITNALQLGRSLYTLQEDVLENLQHIAANLAWTANMSDDEIDRRDARREREEVMNLIRSIRAILNEVEGKTND